MRILPACMGLAHYDGREADESNPERPESHCQSIPEKIGKGSGRMDGRLQLRDRPATRQGKSGILASLSMLTDSIRGMIRRRWTSERPFAGHTSESLRRKLASHAIRQGVREQIQRELDWRERTGFQGRY